MSSDREGEFAALAPLRSLQVPAADVAAVRERGTRYRRRRVAVTGGAIACLAAIGLSVVAARSADTDAEPTTAVGTDQGAAPAPPADDATTSTIPEMPAGFRLTPLPSELPTFTASTAELEADAALIPREERDLWGGDAWAKKNTHLNVFPMFNFEDSLIGIYVSGLGVVPRDVYEAPGFDPEAALKERLGEAAYQQRLEMAWEVVRESEDLFVSEPADTTQPSD